MEYTQKNFKPSKNIEEKLALFHKLMRDGWTSAYSRGLAKIATEDHKYLRNKYPSYERLFVNNNGGKKSWHRYQK